MVELENKITVTQHELKRTRQRLKDEMHRREMDSKSNTVKLQNAKQLHQKQLQRMQSMMRRSNQSGDANVQRVIDLNRDLGESERLKEEYLTELQILKNQFKEFMDKYNMERAQDDNVGVESQRAADYKARDEHRDELLMEINEKCLGQQEEIERLETMVSAAITVECVVCSHGVVVVYQCISVRSIS